MYRARVFVSLKKGVLDPQGSTVKSAMGTLGYEGIQEVRIGKFLDITLDAPDAASAEEQVREMSRRLLANPVLEDFNLVIEDLGGGAPGRLAVSSSPAESVVNPGPEVSRP